MKTKEEIKKHLEDNIEEILGIKFGLDYRNGEIHPNYIKSLGWKIDNFIDDVINYNKMHQANNKYTTMVMKAFERNRQTLNSKV